MALIDVGLNSGTSLHSFALNIQLDGATIPVDLILLHIHCVGDLEENTLTQAANGSSVSSTNCKVLSSSQASIVCQ